MEPHTSVDRSVLRAWRILHDGGGMPVRWRALAGAVAAWPGAPLCVERRLVIPAPDALVGELLVISLAATHSDCPEELDADAGLLARALLSGGPAQALTPSDLRAWEPASPGDVVELRRIGEPHEAWPRHCSLASALAALAAESRRATLSIALAPGRRGSTDGALRCRVRLTSDRTVSTVALAHVGALVGAAPDDWLRSPEPDRTAVDRLTSVDAAASVLGTAVHQQPAPRRPLLAGSSTMST
jgi:hypothetical protein